MGKIYGTRAFCFLFAAGIGFGIIGFANDGYAHDPYTNWMRPDTGGSCCNDQDCRQATARFNGNGWEVMLEGQWVDVPPGRVLDPKKTENPDGMHHVCVSPQRHIYCFMPGEAKF
jgi:hypothetical protein